MKQSIESYILSLLMLGGVLSFSLVLAAPPEPDFQQFYGAVAGAEDGAIIKAQVGENIFETVVMGGEYGKDTPFLAEGKEGDMVTFFIDDVPVETSILAIGEVTQVDLELTGGESMGEEEIPGGEEAMTGEEAGAEGETIPAEEGGEEVLPGEEELETGEAGAETFGEEAASEGEAVLGAEGEVEVSSLEEEEKTEGKSNLFIYLIIVGAAFLLAVAVLLLVFWKKGHKQVAGGEMELFYGETCKHPSHQQYPMHKHERQEGICQAPEHKNYPSHRH